MIAAEVEAAITAYLAGKPKHEFSDASRELWAFFFAIFPHEALPLKPQDTPEKQSGNGSSVEEANGSPTAQEREEGQSMGEG